MVGEVIANTDCSGLGWWVGISGHLYSGFCCCQGTEGLASCCYSVASESPDVYRKLDTVSLREREGMREQCGCPCQGGLDCSGGFVNKPQTIPTELYDFGVVLRATCGGSASGW